MKQLDVLPLLLFPVLVTSTTPAWLEQTLPTPNMTQLDAWLTLPTADIPDLVLMLRRQSLEADADHAFTQWFLRSASITLSVQSYDDSTLTGLAGDNLISASYVIVTDLAKLDKVVARFVHRAGVFFFILTDVAIAVDSDALHAICERMWKRDKVYKLYMLTLNGIWLYDPFEFVESRGGYGKIVSYTGAISLERQLFRDMRGYPLRVQIFKSVYARPEVDLLTKHIRRVHGADGLVAKTLSERMNFTMILQDPEPNYFGERDANGSYTGAIGSIMKDGLDLCLTGFFIKDYMVGSYMKFTVAVYDDELCIYVPKAKRIPQSILPIFAVGYDIWLGFILTAHVCGLIWVLLRSVNLYLGIAHANGKKLWVQACRILNDTWVVWVRVNIIRFPVCYSERIFIASLSLLSVIFGAIFESSLATVYIHPLYYKDINTLQDLDNSGLSVVYKYTSMADDLFFSDTSPLFASLNKKLKWNSDLNADIILDVAENGGKASVTRRSSLMLESPDFTLSKRIWVVPECPKYYTISYVMPKDSPWEETVNAQLLNLLNAGIIDKWINDMHTEVDINIRRKLVEYNQDDGFRILTVGDLQLAYYVVLCGSLLAWLTLRCERLLFHKAKRSLVAGGRLQAKRR